MPFHLAEDTWKMSLEGMYVISFGRRDSRYDRGEGPCGKKMTLDHSNGHYLTTSLKKNNYWFLVNYPERWQLGRDITDAADFKNRGRS